MNETVHLQACLEPPLKRQLSQAGEHDCEAILGIKGQMSLVAQIEQILSMAPGALAKDAAAVAKIGHLDPYLLRSCCQRKMAMTLTAMLRSAGVFDLTTPVVFGHAGNGVDFPSAEPHNVPLSANSLCDSGTKSVQMKLSVESFEVISIETNGTLGSFNDSDFDTDSLMECETSYGAVSVTEDFDLLDSERYRYAGAFNRLKEQHDDISNTLRSSQLKLKALEEQNKRDLEFLRKVSQNGEVIHDKVCEMKSEMSELGFALELLKGRTSTKNVATIKCRLGDLNKIIKSRQPDVHKGKQNNFPLQAKKLEAKVAAQEHAISESIVMEESAKPVELVDAIKQDEPEEPVNSLRLFVNSTIVILIIACWI